MSDFGGTLRAARERRGVSLREISETTKISIPALEALERDDLSRLPGGIFMRSIVRSYAAQIGLDPDQTLDDFLQRFNIDPGPSTLEAQRALDRPSYQVLRRGGMFVKILLASLIAAIILYLALSQPNRQSATPDPADHARRT
jgi:cytoskeletal protein RodZ